MCWAKKNRSTPLIPYTENKNKLKNTYYHSTFSFLLLQSPSIGRRIWQCTGKILQKAPEYELQWITTTKSKILSNVTVGSTSLREKTKLPSKLNRITSWSWLYQLSLAASAFSATGSAGPSWGRCHQCVHWRIRLRVQEIYLQHTFYSSN